MLQAILKQDFRAIVRKYTGFEYRSKQQRLVASNNYLDLVLFRAYSYGHWCYMRNVEGLIVFNDYRYSATTTKHQDKMKSLLSKLGVTIDIYINTKCSIEYFDIRSVIEELQNEKERLEIRLADCKRAVSNKKTRILDSIQYINNQLYAIGIHNTQLVQKSSESNRKHNMKLQLVR